MFFRFLKILCFSTVFVALFSVFLLIFFFHVRDDHPILSVSIIKKSKSEILEWKNPGTPLQTKPIDLHEVRLATPEGDLIAEVLVPGDLISVRAKVIRLRPFFHLFGLRNLCSVDLLVNGYSTAQRQERLPSWSCPIAYPKTSISLIWDFWNRLFFSQEKSFWIKSATLESNYFPLVDASGRPIEASYLLTVNEGGLSALPL